ncbi:hypothetical protein AHAS_Ahas03G0125900 [Arachis hypogaea]
MSYDIGDECLADEVFAQMLMSNVSHSLEEGAISSLQNILLSQIKICKITFEKFHQIATLFGFLILTEFLGRKDLAARFVSYLILVMEQGHCCKNESKECDNHHKHTEFGWSIQPLHCIKGIDTNSSQHISDIVFHGIHRNWMPETMPQVDRTYLPIFDRVGFNRLRWHASRKLS